MVTTLWFRWEAIAQGGGAQQLLARISVTDMVTPTYTKVVKGKGMPSSKDPTQRGDLVVTFDIVYPKAVSTEAKEQLKNILPRC